MMRFITPVMIAYAVAGPLNTVLGQDKLPAFISPYRHGVDVSGENTAPEVPEGRAFAWVVSIGKRGSSHALGGHFCGGSVVGAEWIITAAHCLNGISKDDVQIKIGYELHEASASALYYPEEVVIHDQYSVTPWNSVINDIALIRTDREIQVDSVSVVRPYDAPAVAKEVYVLGWGQPGAELNYLSERLRYLVLEQIDGNKCNESYPGLIDDKVICAVGNGRDACQGDSGGPLVGKDSVGNLFLYGIVSWGDQCGENNRPGIYVSLPAYYDWLVHNIGS